MKRKGGEERDVGRKKVRRDGGGGGKWIMRGEGGG